METKTEARATKAEAGAEVDAEEKEEEEKEEKAKKKMANEKKEEHGGDGGDGGHDTDAIDSEAELSSRFEEEDDDDNGILDIEWPTHEKGIASTIASGIANISLSTFFSKVEVVNEERIPDEGPVILYGNHSNQFVDGMVMMKAAERNISFVAAEVSVRKPVIGHLLRALDAVPVIRPQDRATYGPGTLEEINMARRIITGKGTEFTKIQPGSMVGNSEVGQFILESAESDTKMKYKPLRAEDRVQLDKLKEANRYKITPKVEHAEMFQKVYDYLAQGKCIGIFPEGGSHDRTELLPLKVGVAIMALGAWERGIPVKLVPVGINYFSGHVFRSIVFVDVGKPVQISPSLVKLYKNKETKRDACSQLLELMRTALDLVFLTAPDYETLKVLRTARRLYQGKVELTPREYIDLNLKFSTAYSLWKENKEFQKLMHDIHDYLEFARSQGLKDKQVRDLAPLGRFSTMLNALIDVFTTVGLITIILPVVMPGLVLNLPLILYSRRVIPKEMKKALAKSSVKIAARDVAASQQIMIGLKIIPLLHVFYSMLWLIFFYVTWPYYKVQAKGTLAHMFAYNAWWFLPLCFLFLGPYYSFALCPQALEKVNRKWRLMPRYLLAIESYFKSFFLGSSSTNALPAELLRQERKRLTVRVQDLVEKLIKDFPEWNQTRIINREKVLKKRSKSIRRIAKGDLTPKLPSRPSFENLSRLSFS